MYKIIASPVANGICFIVVLISCLMDQFGLSVDVGEHIQIHTLHCKMKVMGIIE